MNVVGGLSLGTWWLPLLAMAVFAGMIAFGCGDEADRLSRPNVANPTLGYVEFLGEVSEEITESQTTRVVVVQARGGRSIALEQLLRCSTVKVDLLNVEFSERVPSVGDLVQVEGPLLDPCELIAAEFVPMR